MASENGSRLRGLDTREATELLGLDRDLLPEANLVGGAAEEVDTVRVERLVDRLHARRRALHAHLRRGLREPLVSEVLDEGCAHGELDPVEGDEPDDVLCAQDSVEGFKRQR